MISEILLRFGSVPSAAPSPLAITPVTVFVGPNNSGKSKILSEIEYYCSNGHGTATDKLVQSLTFSGLSAVDASATVELLREEPNLNEALQPNHVILSSRRHRQQTDYGRLIKAVQSPATDVAVFCSWFLRHLTLKLDGPGRVVLINQQPAGDFQRAPRNTLSVLFLDNDKRAEVRRIVHDAFGSYFVIDPTALGTLRIRLSDRPPANDLEERNVHAEGIAFHSHATLIDQASDGVKAFTGIIVELIAGDPKVLLIDEPEAFLHPSLASKLGLEVSRAAVQSEKRVFASTHSPTFLMGCIQSGAPINIVRLTYRGGVPTARVLPSSDILELMRNPLLRSTGVLNGLFYEFVVVTEADADRAFYEEINERLLRLRPEWGIPNCLFLNTQGKHSVHTILTPLRKLGIPAVGIVDVDILKEGGASWSNIIDGANVPEVARNALATLRTAIKAKMDASGKDMKRQGGVAILEAADREAAENLLQQLSEYGIFIVPGGELESWLKHLGASGHGPAWLTDMFTRMGSDPDAGVYVAPADGDVWEFLSGIKTWLINPNRKGVPA